MPCICDILSSVSEGIAAREIRKMFKIEIQADDGRELKVSRDNFIYYRDAEGRDSYWEWEHIRGKAKQFDPIFEEAKMLIEKVESRLPDLPMTGLR
jgi:hypothetical protein